MVIDREEKLEKLRGLQLAYIDQLPTKLSSLQDAWFDVRVDEHCRAVQLSDLRRQVHSIAGAAGTFGLMHLGEQAREFEQYLCGLPELAALDPLARDTIDGYLEQLQILGKNGPEKEPVGASTTETPGLSVPEEKNRIIFLVEDDEMQAENAALHMRRYGYEVRVFSNAIDARKAIQVQQPSAMIVDLELPEGVLAGPELVAQMKSHLPENIPVIFASVRDDWHARLAAVRAGGHAYLSKPLDLASLLHRLEDMFGRVGESPCRVLIVDDMQVLAEHHALVLEDVGVETMTLTDTTKILDVMQSFSPELILMDLHMPHVSGMEVASVIRQKDAYISVPIVYLSTEAGLERQLAALRVGGDDFLQKPISDEHLRSAVSIRISRFRSLTQLMVRDGLTGLLNHISLKMKFEEEIARALRNKEPLTFAMLDLDHFKSVNDKYGHLVGDSVLRSLAIMLRQRLRKTDVVGRYGGEEFAVILPETMPELAKELLDELRENFSKINHVFEEGVFNVTFSAGLSSLAVGDESDEIIQAADDALYRAKNAGRNVIEL